MLPEPSFYKKESKEFPIGGFESTGKQNGPQPPKPKTQTSKNKNGKLQAAEVTIHLSDKPN